MIKFEYKNKECNICVVNEINGEETGRLVIELSYAKDDNIISKFWTPNLVSDVDKYKDMIKTVIDLNEKSGDE